MVNIYQPTNPSINGNSPASSPLSTDSSSLALRILLVPPSSVAIIIRARSKFTSEFAIKNSRISPLPQDLPRRQTILTQYHRDHHPLSEIDQASRAAEDSSCYGERVAPVPSPPPCCPLVLSWQLLPFSVERVVVSPVAFAAPSFVLQP